MKARPILFKPDMVNAILEGRKTMTRRIVKPLAGAGWRPETANGDTLRLGMITSPHPKKGKFGLFMRREIHPGSGKYEHDLVPCPYGAPGDVLWVRETWTHEAESVEACRASFEDQMGGNTCGPYYLATESAPETLRWKPSIHMPRWASRITLEITDVRVERLQDISEADADSECFGGDFPGAVLPELFPGEPERWSHLSIPECFACLWESINGPGSWDANPWVWVVEFQPHHMNVDAFLRGREVA